MSVDRRLVRNAVLLSLPTLAVVVLGIFFFVDKVPEIVKGERARVRAVYRETAEAIRQQPERYSAEPDDKWKPAVGKMAPGKWGYRDFADRVLVWYGDGTATHSALVPREPERDYALMFGLGGLFVLLVLIGITVVGIRYFVGYSRERDDFLAATAHDLTTPLVGMRLLIGRNDDEARRLNERMVLLVNNIKDFLKLGGKRRPLESKPVDLVTLVREAYRLFAADYAESQGGAVDFSCDASELPALADETMTLQILWNLFGNDLKYASPHGKVRARMFAEGGFAVFELADEGPGMTAEQMKKCFDRYYRAKTAWSSGKGGFGLGLGTAKELAEAMGGRLSVRSESPHGCIFALALPQPR